MLNIYSLALAKEICAGALKQTHGHNSVSLTEIGAHQLLFQRIAHLTISCLQKPDWQSSKPNLRLQPQLGRL